jgi:fructose-bisphosphate aldolase class I
MTTQQTSEPQTTVGAHTTKADMKQTLGTLCTLGKGILAADESTNTIGKRLAAINVTNTSENRYKYRHLLATTTDLNKYISGVILYEEALKTPDTVKAFQDQGILVGIKVDKGPVDLTEHEKITQGITGLGERCREYHQLGARFAKWRCVIDVNQYSEFGVNQNANILARYAKIAQQSGLVPIVEPELLMTGTNSLEQSFMATKRFLVATFKALHDHNVMLDCMILKPNMVRCGDKREQALMTDVARKTIDVLELTVPMTVPGVFFLSGGMSEQDATEALGCINDIDGFWYLSFSYGRALQKSVLEAWQGKDENVEKAQQVLLKRSKECSEVITRCPVHDH